MINLPHHIKHDLCTTRPAYRQGRKLTAVKVYTVNDESQHLLIYNVPAIKLIEEVRNLCVQFGNLIGLFKLVTENDEQFTDTYHAHFEHIKNARFAKKYIDDRPFYGGVLHVCYAPEMETVEETRFKLINRRKEVAYHSDKNINSTSFIKTKFIPNKGQKRKYPDPSEPSTSGVKTPRLINQSQNSENLDCTLHQTFVPPGFEYPSQKVWTQPGNSHNQNLKQASKLIPSSVIKLKLKQQEPNKIIFHKKTE